MEGALDTVFVQFPVAALVLGVVFYMNKQNRKDRESSENKWQDEFKAQREYQKEKNGKLEKILDKLTDSVQAVHSQVINKKK